MNTLTGIEAERVQQILRHAIERLQILNHVPMNLEEDIISQIPGHVVLKSLENQAVAEEQLVEMGDAVGSVEAGGKDISILKQTHKATRATCRNLMADRASLQVLMEVPEIQSDDFSRFIRYLMELKKHVHERLTTTVEDEAANRTMLHDLTQAEATSEEKKDVLQKKLHEVHEKKEHVTFNLDQTLKKLRGELETINEHNAIELKTVKTEMEDAITKATSDHELRMKQLQDQVDGMERQTQEVMDKNRDEEQRLRKEKTRAELVS